MSLITLNSDELRAERERRANQESYAEQAQRWSDSLRAYVRAAWATVEPHNAFVDGWHIDAVADALQNVTEGKIRKLQIWVPPGSMKSRLVSIMWPTWEWTRRPEVRYLTASYGDRLSRDLTFRSRSLIQSTWYQDRWGHVFEIPRGREMLSEYSNDQGGQRISTTPGGTGTGRHADRIIIDDPINAQAADATTDTVLEQVIQWYDGVLSTRFADVRTGVEVIVMQRLHERDLAAHALSYGPQDWEILCLPERYESGHPYAWRKDPRTEGELLWPERFPEEETEKRKAKLGSHRAAGQLQQRPAAREGELLKRAHWKYYPRANWDASKWPERFRLVVSSWDTSFKDKTSSDYVAGQVWGATGANKFLLRLTKQRMALGATKRAIQEYDTWMRKTFPGVPIYHLIEKSANGVEVIAELKREIPGILAVTVSTDKVLRAEAAEPSLESGSVWVPGMALADGSDYDPALTPADVQDFIENCAAFPMASHDDDVDAFTQAINWMNSRAKRSVRMTVAEGVLR